MEKSQCSLRSLCDSLWSANHGGLPVYLYSDPHHAAHQPWVAQDGGLPGSNSRDNADHAIRVDLSPAMRFVTSHGVQRDDVEQRSRVWLYDSTCPWTDLALSVRQGEQSHPRDLGGCN